LMLMVAGCASKTLTLPDNPIDKAASCGVVAAVKARADTPNVKSPLPFDAQGRIIHYALLAASEGGSYDADTAAAVNKRMSALQQPIIDGKWQQLEAPCSQAFPVADATVVKLPTDRFEAQLGCVALGKFLANAMASVNADYADQLNEYLAFDRKMDRSSLPAALQGRAGGDLEAQQKVRNKTLAKTVEAGSPMLVMRECMKRFG